MGQKKTKRIHRNDNRMILGIFHPCASRNRASRSGITLLELVTVIALLGILTTVTTTRYSTSLLRIRAKATAERLQADLNMARRRACIMGKSVSVIFNPATHTYDIPQVASLNLSQQAYQINLTSSPFHAVLDSVSFPGGTGGDTQVVFDHYGAPDSGGSVVVRCGEITKTVSLNSTTGEATIP